MEDDPAQYGREHEVRTCVDDTDTDCTAGKRERACK